MNSQIRNRDKKIAILLIAAFAWLFIGSLIIFHEEHVLGKHFRVSSQLFISPKSNEKKDFTLAPQKSLLKFQDKGYSAGNISEDQQSAISRISFEYRSWESSSLLPDDILVTQSALRAPPYSC
jgi:hypothetical protein